MPSMRSLVAVGPALFALFSPKLVQLATAAPTADEIKTMPGWDQALPSKQYRSEAFATTTFEYPCPGLSSGATGGQPSVETSTLRN